MTTPTKICSRCKQELPVTCFSYNICKKDWHSYCKPCASNYIKERYRKEPFFRQHILDQAHKSLEREKTDPVYREHRRIIKAKHSRSYKQRNKEKISTVNRANRFIYSFPEIVDLLWFRAKNKCELCGCDLNRQNKKGYLIHHKDENRKNNHFDNLALLCTKCHLHKVHKTP